MDPLYAYMQCQIVCSLKKTHASKISWQPFVFVFNKFHFIKSNEIHYNCRHCWNSSTSYRNPYTLFYLWNSVWKYSTFLSVISNPLTPCLYLLKPCTVPKRPTFLYLFFSNQWMQFLTKFAVLRVVIIWIYCRGIFRFLRVELNTLRHHTKTM